MKKNILLFSRLDFSHFYGNLSDKFEKNFKIIHLAYSDLEEDILKNIYHIDKIINLKYEVSKILNNLSVSDKIIKEIDSLIINQSENRFSLNSSIEADRTYTYLGYQNSLKLCVAYYIFWDKLIKELKVDYILHEPTSLFLTQIASLLCKKYNSKYLTMIGVFGPNKHNWIILSGDNGFADELACNLKTKESVTDIEIKRTISFINSFRKDNAILYQKSAKNRINSFILILISLKFFLKSIKNKLIYFFSDINLIDHIEKFNFENLSSFNEIQNHWKIFLKLKFDDFKPNRKYYYYPLHYEPEAVVLYWGDGIYKNQVKLIENIAGQLPPNVFLYVKDHPHAGYYRDYDDYLKIQKIQNVKLLKSSISGKKIIKNSLGVLTINGTSGLEAILYKKHVFTFGNAFYSPLKYVERIYNIRDLRSKLYIKHNQEIIEDDDYINTINCYLNSIHEGFCDYYIKFDKIYEIDNSKNSLLIAKKLSSYFSKF